MAALRPFAADIPPPSGGRLLPAPPPPDLTALTPDERADALREHAAALDLWKLHVTTMTEVAKVGAETSRLAVAQLLVLNAGAAVALVTFVGNIVGRGNIGIVGELAPRLAPALLAYAIGALLALLVSATATLSHDAVGGMRMRAAARWRFISRVVFGLGVAAFGIGTAIAAAVLLRVTV